MISTDEKNSVPILEIDNLAISYETRKGDVRAVRGVSLKIEEGETVGVVGESGCGKSTIAFGIVNFLGHNGKITGGSIKFGGQELVGTPVDELRKIRGNRIAMVYQDPMRALNPALTIGRQMNEVLIRHRNLSKPEAQERSIAMLERVYMPDPANVMKRYPHQLSGGQLQRVVIAMAMLNHPDLLIMDEPTTALDVTVETVILDLIEDLKKDFNTGIIYITHDLGVVARVSQQLCVMYAGELVEHGSTPGIFESPSHPYTRGLLTSIPRLEYSKESTRLYHIPGIVPPAAERPEDQCVFAPRCDIASAECVKTRPDLRPLMSGHLVRCCKAEEVLQIPLSVLEHQTSIDSSDADQETHSKLLLQTKDLSVHYEYKSDSVLSLIGLDKKQTVKAVNSVNLDVNKAQTLGIVGESGCGKSTLVKTIIGLNPITGGEIDFLGVDLNTPVVKRDMNLLRRIQMVFQNPNSTLNPSYTVGRQIGRSMKILGIVPRDQIRSEVVRLLKAVRLDEVYFDRLPRQLSGGEKQRVGIARALASQPDLILCDEPVSALDVSVQAAVINLLMDIQEEFRTTMIFIAHDLSVVRLISDAVAVMYLGQIMEKGPSESIYKPPHHPYTEALLAAVQVPDPTVKRKGIRLYGEVPSSLNPPQGCRFHTRCFRREALLPDGGKICETQAPPWQMVNEEHGISCHIPLDKLYNLDGEE